MPGLGGWAPRVEQLSGRAGWVGRVGRESQVGESGRAGQAGSSDSVILSIYIQPASTFT